MTYEQFNIWLDEEISWRRKELIVYRKLIANSNAGEEQAILRGAFTVLYAHWEGFIKKSGDKYIEYVRIRKLDYGQLSKNFVAIAVKNLLQQGGASQKIHDHIEIIDLLVNNINTRAKFPKKEIIDAESNLKVDVFKNIILTLGLDYRDEYSVAEKPIIERMLDIRNHIAHGSFRIIDRVEYDQIYKSIDDLLILFRNEIGNAALLQKYRSA